MVEDIPLNGMRTVSILDRAILIANIEGKFYAMDGTCSHQFANLSFGQRDKYIIECPRHGARYDIRTGKVVQNLGPEHRVNDLRAYRVEIVDGCLHIDM
mgnify:CR=1 FL=1